MTGKKSYDGTQITRSLEVEDARQKIARYCAYQERAHSEVEEKLYSFGLRRSEIEELLAWLITENFVNEERFAIAFAGGKFRVKQWGRIKIKQYLEQKKVSSYSIDKALHLIDDEDYNATLDKLILTTSRKTKSSNLYEHRHKISRTIINKGYEPDIVWTRLKMLVSDEYEE